MKKCINCGREVVDEAKFCQFCGSKLPDEQVNVSGEYYSNNQIGENQAPPLPDSPVSYDYSRSEEDVVHTNKGLVWLIVSSVVTLLGCCCVLPLGFLAIASIVTSAISVSKYNRRDYEGSDQMAKVSMIIFFSVLALSVILLIVALATGYFTDAFNQYSDFYSEFY